MPKDENFEEDEFGIDEGETDLYSKEGREDSMEDDEIDEIEEGFMQGYEGGERLAKCALCKKVLGADFYEEEIDGEIYRFCSEKHAEIFLEKKKEKEE